MDKLIPIGNITRSLTEKLGRGAFIVMCKGYKKLTPHITEKTIWVVEKPELLKDYAPDIRNLYYAHGGPIKEIASLFGMSTSYAYKLLKK